MRIEADHITFTDDGHAHAWWVVDGERVETTTLSDSEPTYVSGAWEQLLDRPCDTCDGSHIWRDDDRPGEVIPCPCIDGRHTFEIEVDCGKTRSCLCSRRHRDGNCTTTHRVSIVEGMVLPIISVLEPVTDENCDRDEITMAQSGSAWRRCHRLEPFPPAAKPGMWAVKLRTEPATT